MVYGTDLTQDEADQINMTNGNSFEQVGDRIRDAEVSITTLEAEIVRLKAEGTIGVPLTALRLIASNDIGTLAAEAGGVLASNSEPALRRQDGATNKGLVIDWASSASNVPVTVDVPLPENLNASADIIVECRALKSEADGAGKTSRLTFVTTFNEHSAKASTITLTATVIATKSHTIAASNVPASAHAMTIEIAPDHSTSSSIELHGLRVRYQRTLS